MGHPVDWFCFSMGHFNRLITIMYKDRKDRKARTARARVSGPGFGPEKLEPDPDRGISSPNARQAAWFMSCDTIIFLPQLQSTNNSSALTSFEVNEKFCTKEFIQCDPCDLYLLCDSALTKMIEIRGLWSQHGSTGFILYQSTFTSHLDASSVEEMFPVNGDQHR